jgi:hypothetical protein
MIGTADRGGPRLTAETKDVTTMPTEEVMTIEIETGSGIMTGTETEKENATFVAMTDHQAHTAEATATTHDHHITVMVWAVQDKARLADRVRTLVVVEECTAIT